MLWQKVKRWFERLVEIGKYGGRQDLTKRRTGNRFLDKLSSLRVDIWLWLNWLDSKFTFRRFPYQAIPFRVRTRPEQIIADFLYKRGVRVVYEKKLRLGPKHKIVTPDFYLPDYGRHGIYIEFWGPTNRFKKYALSRAEKEALYKSCGIRYISLEPGDQFRLDKVLPKLFEQATVEILPPKKRTS